MVLETMRCTFAQYIIMATLQPLSHLTLQCFHSESFKNQARIKEEA